MRTIVRRATVVALILLSGSVSLAQVPIAVSPGSSSEVSLCEARCPTFSWGQVPGASEYELVVYELGDAANDEPVLQRAFPGSVHSWTPAVGQCLERGGRYAWTIRASLEAATAEWSAPNLFQVVSDLNEGEPVATPTPTPVRDAGHSAQSFVDRQAAPAAPAPRLSARLGRSVRTRAPASGTAGLTVFGDPCCNGAQPDNYAALLANNSAQSDPDVLALLVSEKHSAGPNVNFIGFFDREELTSTPRLIGEIESTAGGNVHFTGSASISGWERVSSPTLFFCPAGQTACHGSVDCSAGKRVLGGGFAAMENAGLFLWASYPSDDDTWSVALGNSGGTSVSFSVDATCAEVGP